MVHDRSQTLLSMRQRGNDKKKTMGSKITEDPLREASLHTVLLKQYKQFTHIYTLSK